MATTYNNLAVLAVCAYYISKTRDLKKITLTLKEIDGSHTRENLATAIYNIIKDWSISINVGYFVMDNTVVNNKMLKEYLICKLMPYSCLITKESSIFLLILIYFLLFSRFFIGL
jgi:hypothetical protein